MWNRSKVENGQALARDDINRDGPACVSSTESADRSDSPDLTLDTHHDFRKNLPENSFCNERMGSRCMAIPPHIILEHATARHRYVCFFRRTSDALAKAEIHPGLTVSPRIRRWDLKHTGRPFRRRDMGALCLTTAVGVLLANGAPRNVVVVKEQLEDYRTVIKYARQQAQFDPQRVVIWGSSFSGGHAITLSTQPAVNACAALAQCPYAGVYPSNPFGWTYLMTVAFMLLDLLKQALGLPPAYIPAVAKPGAVGALTSEGTVTGMMTLVSPESQYTNQISASSLLQIPLYQPRSKAKEIACPLLLFVPTKDNLCLPAGAREVAATAPEGRCQLVEAECGHFDIYHGTSHYKQALTAQLAFLAKHVPL
ncbi:Hydrolase-4 domain-containing protein [Mycena indigotica]|uniref:Hydrolase-4 domain-containing protein n=1 Tax=Mycena indigotica TaxID=2126181 RepID=A0A8H6WEJ3_9AGAR|nr:Hydrolase-4 domain-containing protein [Mycena indigotica]KAF7311913.1 Hydrolase-4 domain-containing protein [Mycena indigotica]